MIVGATWETFGNFATGLGGFLTGIAALLGVTAAYFRFRRTREGRLNVSMELTPSWSEAKGRLIVVVRVHIKNDGGRPFTMLAEPPGAGTSKVGVSVLAKVPRLSLDKPVKAVPWDRQPGTSAPLFAVDEALGADDTWHADFAFTVLASAQVARVAIELWLQEAPGRLDRGRSDIVMVRTDTITVR